MNSRSCLHCGEALPERSRADRRTCSMRCHVAAWRAAKRAEVGSHAVRTAVPENRPPAPVVVVTSPALGSADVGTQLALWLADVAVEHARAATAGPDSGLTMERAG